MTIAIDLSGHKALITGGDTGLGAATSMALARAGAEVVIAYRGARDQADKLAGEARSAGAKATTAVLEDVSDPACVAAVFEMLDHEGPVDILVNNAGIDGERQLCAESDPAAWRRVIEVNLFGAYYCAREALRSMIANKRGVIINTSSVHEAIPWTGYSAYTASKAGLSMFTRTLAQETAKQGIRVVAVAPGAIKTPINASVWQDTQARADLRQKIAMGRIGEPKDIGQVIAFLCSDLAAYITGVTITVDGGMMLYPDFREGG